MRNRIKHFKPYLWKFLSNQTTKGRNLENGIRVEKYIEFSENKLKKKGTMLKIN